MVLPIKVNDSQPIMDKDYNIEELHEYFVKLHKKIHWLLIYKEENYESLDNYFDYVLFQTNGLHQMLDQDYRIIELRVLLESAKIEADKDDYDHHLYRKAILDAHGIVDDLDKEYCHE